MLRSTYGQERRYHTVSRGGVFSGRRHLNRSPGGKERADAHKAAVALKTTTNEFGHISAPGVLFLQTKLQWAESGTQEVIDTPEFEPL